MIRRVYAFSGPPEAYRAVQALRRAGIEDGSLSLVARADIELDRLPDRMLDVRSDMGPAAVRGAAFGCASGLLAGLVAAAIPPLGITLGGAALLAFSGVGAALGAWSSALIGATVPNDVRRTFEAEIEQGRVLLIVDHTDVQAAQLDALAAELGGRLMPLDGPLSSVT